MNSKKYKAYPLFPIENRKWPDKAITKAPVWCSVDLRDGNQALSVPMNVEKKLELFKLLVSMGFKEIEIGFPASSETEFQFVRTLIEEGHIPEDVTIQVLTQGKPRIIERTMEAIRGAGAVIINLYYPTAKLQREVVLKKSKKETIDSIRSSVKHLKNLRDELRNTSVQLEYCPENFMSTEADFALEASNTAIDEWQPDAERKMIINIPATVEVSTPNIFADKVEWISGNLIRRCSVILSIHTHNDRGTAVAAGELALMAGAQRIEGTLFGNGERSGNMDIVTMALNMFTQGVDPQLDLSNINSIADTYIKCTGMNIHPRHPYAGERAFSTFSGSHQDAIRKAVKARAQKGEEIWDMPYLPIDPQDIGRKDERLIRISSQSGKGGIAYILEKNYGIQIPEKIQESFCRSIKSIAECSGREVTPEEVLEQYKAIIYDNHLSSFQQVTLRPALEEMEKKMIAEALKNSKGNMSQAARMLGLTERMIGIRAKKYKIDFRRFR